MMSLSQGMVAAQAGGYFAQEDYYLKGGDQGQHSRWCGKGAESLGLSGPVGEEEFRALCAGRHPVTGEQLVFPKLTRDKTTGKLIETHRAGNDCTLSDSKTVSIAYMLRVPGVKDAHDAAVLAVVRDIEEHYSFCRRLRGGGGGYRSGRRPQRGSYCQKSKVVVEFRTNPLFSALG